MPRPEVGPDSDTADTGPVDDPEEDPTSPKAEGPAEKNPESGTGTDAAAASGIDEAPDTAPTAADDTRPLVTGLRRESLLALEIAGLCGLAFTRPILDSYGNAPEAFLARDASGLDILLFSVVVAVAPTLLVAGIAALTNLGGARVRRTAQIVLVALLGGVAAWRYGTDLTELAVPPLLALATAVAVTLGVLRWRATAAASFLRFLGATSVLFLLLFLVASPASDLIFQGAGAGASEQYAEAVLDQTDGEPPPIVVLTIDATPTSMLLDGDGRIDASLYPNLADLAGDATWYRNYSTMHGWTYQALPLMFSGQVPENPGALPDARTYPDNLFTLFAGTHDVNAVEQISRLCPTSVCPRTSSSPLPNLVGDAADWWRTGTDPNRETGQVLPGALENDRDAEFRDWLAEQDFDARSDRPGLWAYHLVLPHEPWYLLPDGTSYRVHDEAEYGLILHNEWQEVGPEVARQRQILQLMAVDDMIGDLLDELRAADLYDEALVTVVGDHGQAFTPGSPIRGVAEDQYEQVMWTPLIVKAPGQTEGTVDDTNLQSVDLTPTIADTLDIELPYEVAGLPPDEAASRREPDDKWLLPHEHHRIEAGDDGMVHVDGVTGFERVLDSRAVDDPGGGEEAVWQRTEHGALLGERLDDLNIEETGDGALEVENLDDLEEQTGATGPLLLELIGHTELDVDTTVAVAVDGEIATVAPTAPPSSGSFTSDGEFEEGPDRESTVHALLHPDAWDMTISGPHTLTAYHVTGPPDAPILTPLTVEPA